MRVKYSIKWEPSYTTWVDGSTLDVWLGPKIYRLPLVDSGWNLFVVAASEVQNLPGESLRCRCLGSSGALEIHISFSSNLRTLVFPIGTITGQHTTRVITPSRLPCLQAIAILGLPVKN
jgi:hypothetical protein